jgi:hypothetical protein
MKTLRKYWYLGLLAAIAVFGALEMITGKPGHEGSGFLEKPGAMAIIGFLGCLILTALAKFAGHHILERDEDYYNRGDND